MSPTWHAHEDPGTAALHVVHEPPALIADIPDNDALRPIAQDAATRIRAALDEVANR